MSDLAKATLAAIANYAEKANDAAVQYTYAKLHHGGETETSREHATDVQVYAAAASALGVALESGAIK